ncbi:hypothetical protein AZF37_08055 [endosymbiont 'TC1' of Trimyema compressum]|uniref:immunoglobulin-like domain-containing protein n=1 Tax=endosymbiont 'TC1' of Trimyema compressum TaxID=243899 RepID=UPI0007F12D64|nr:immunoglobulin-like domain-containing protein [endosymbiont 'TC1' of Trimyema compressum]AMP21116.1 hypothetical protein AZF37_08055 [endosymbiont 'TC1' of Trimyema compressum]
MKDKGGLEARKTITVPVIDNSNPIVYLPVIHASDKTIYVNDLFDPMEDVKAICPLDGDITNLIEIATNTVDTSKVGLYDVVYTVTNSTNQDATKAVKINVISAVKINVISKKP